MVQAANCQPFAAEAQVLTQASSCGIRCGQSGTGTVFSPSTSFFPFVTSLNQSFIYQMRGSLSK